MPSAVIDTPIGRLRLDASDVALTGVWFRAAEPASRERLRGVLAETKRQIDAYFARDLTRFDLPIAPAGTPFQRAVWDALLDIPYGETRSYAAVAQIVGRPAAVRAVGAANGANPIPIIVPCHRVIGTNGSLTGFGGGLDVKRRLLALERRDLLSGA